MQYISTYLKVDLLSPTSNDTSFIKCGDNMSLLCSWSMNTLFGTQGVTCIVVTLCSRLHQGKCPEAREDTCLHYFASTPDTGFWTQQVTKCWLPATNFCVFLQDFPSIENYNRIFHEAIIYFFFRWFTLAWLKIVSKHVWHIHGTRTVVKYYVLVIQSDVVY